LQSAGIELAMTLSYESDMIAMTMFINRIGTKKEKIINMINCVSEYS